MKRNVLHQPYPFDSSLKRAFLTAIAFGFFVGLFLLIFQPFGLSTYNGKDKVLQILGYGLVTTVVLFSNYALFRAILPKWFHKSSWTVLKNVGYTTWVFLCIGSANLLYSHLQGFVELSISGFFRFQLLTVLVGVLPVILSTLLIYHRRMSKMVSEANTLNANIKDQQESTEQINIPSQNKSEGLEVAIDHLLAIKAVENYVEIYFLKEGQLQKEMLRNTLKNIERALIDHAFVQKCHRSFLVNLQQVDHFSGNAQGLSLYFHALAELQIPVSRSFVKDIKEQLS